MEKLILLICEGETDLIVFDALASHLSTLETKLTFQSLAPQRDATSGTYPPNGFGEVLNWCKSNKDRYHMFLDFKGASALYVQLDTDIAKQINENCVKLGNTPRQCCEEQLNKSFQTSREPERCHYILPTQNTESWILAAHDEVSWLDENKKVILNYELLSSEEYLVKLGYSSTKSGKRRRLNKSPASRYGAYANRLTSNLDTARQRCKELDRLCKLMKSV